RPEEEGPLHPVRDRRREELLPQTEQRIQKIERRKESAGESPQDSRLDGVFENYQPEAGRRISPTADLGRKPEPQGEQTAPRRHYISVVRRLIVGGRTIRISHAQLLAERAST